MKSLLLTLIVGAACAQTQPPPMQLPPPGAPPQATMPDLPDDTLIATLDDGTRLTMGDFRKIYAALPPQNQSAVLRDRKNFLQQWSLMRKLAMMAEKEKLDQASPFKEAIEYNRMAILSQAELNDGMNKVNVDQDEVVKYYEANKDKYKTVRVKAIYIGFVSDPKNGLTEEQAKAKITKLLAQVRAGAEFGKLAKENSDDETSKNKDGDFATLRLTDNIPDAIRTAVFSLKQGEVTEPVRQPNGFYILKADEITLRPLSQLQSEIYQQVRQQRYGQWLDKLNRETKVVINSPEFIGEKPAPAPPAK